MFGFARRKAINWAVQNIRPMIAGHQHLHGLPAGFWADEYVLGFVGTLIVVLIHEAAPNLSKLDNGYAIMDAFQQLSNMNGTEVARRHQDLWDAKSEAYMRGHNNASTLALYMSSNLKNEDGNPDVVAARKFVSDSSFGLPGDRGEIASVLMSFFFTDEIRRRFA